MSDGDSIFRRAFAESQAKFDLAWTGDTPDPDCPSCKGTGWATVFAGTITVAGGRCECRGGTVWAGPRPPHSSTETEG